MYIKDVYIKNFRNLDCLEIKDLKKRFLIIGKNDSGKSNFCYAIRKVLDYETRKEPMVESDSTDSNKEDITIKITLKWEDDDDDNMHNNKLAWIGEYIDEDEDKVRTLTVELNAKFNEDTQEYDQVITFGTIDKITTFTISNKLDKVLDFFYVYPNYNLELDTKKYFLHQKSKNKDKNKNLNKDTLEKIKELNTSITKDSVIKDLHNELKDQFELIKDIFDDETSFEISSNFEVSNIYKSLKITPLNSRLEKEINIGDGAKKTLSLLLQKLTKEIQKEKIIVLEEPENHLFPLLQKHYASAVNRFNFSQTIVTTHSPSIIDFRKIEEIFKFGNYKKEESPKNFVYHRVNTDGENIYEKFGFSLNEEIAESFFYDEVLLIEGYSEKIFYNLLVNMNEDFREKILKKSIGFLPIYSTDFAPAKSILESLGIKVHILTDIDFHKLPKDKKGNQKSTYGGLKRAWKLLNLEQQKQINEKFLPYLDQEFFSIEKINNDTFNFVDGSFEKIFIDKIKKNLIDQFSEFNIYIQESFEDSFTKFIGLDKNEKEREEVIESLSKSKMKGLHKYLNDNKVDLSKINLAGKDKNKQKENVLIKFIYEN